MPAVVTERLSSALDIRAKSAAELGRAVGVSQQTAVDYKRGRAMPSDLTLDRIANVLEFPRRFFETPLLVEQRIKDEDAHLRARSRIRAGDWNRVRALSEVHLEVMQVIGDLIGRQRLPRTQVPTSADLDENGSTYAPEVSGARDPAYIEEMASAVRRSWGLGDRPIPDLVRQFEAKGIWVQVLAREDQNIDAFSYWLAGRAMIILNHAKRDPYRSRFDAAHELGHLVLHSMSGHRNHEVEANMFASAFLLPAETWSAVAPRSSNPWDYLPLKAVWGVSAACMIYRSKTLRLISESQFESAMVRYSMLKWRQGEPPSGVREWSHEQPHLLDRCVDVLEEKGIGTEPLSDRLPLGDDLWRSIFGAERWDRLTQRSFRLGVERKGAVLQFPAPKCMASG